MVSTSLRALIVDDEAAVRKLLVRALSKQGFECDQASDGQQAARLAQAIRFDLIVADLRMPVRNGHALCVEMLAQRDRPRIVVLTGVIEPRLHRDLVSRGVDAVFFKPVDSRMFAAQVKAIVDAAPRGAGTTPTFAGDVPKDSTPHAETAVGGHAGSGEVEDRPHGRSEPGNDDARGPLRAAAGSTRHNIAVLLADRDRGGELARLLGSETANAVAADGSESFHALLNSQRIDLVVLENELSGFLSGLEMVERLQKDLLQPDTLLLSNRPEEIRSAAERLGISAIQESQAETETIADRVATLLRERTATSDFISPIARGLVRDCNDIAPLPQLMLKLVSYLSMDLVNIPLKQLSKDISVDPKATAELLRVTNSSSSGVSRKIANVFDAVKLLGAKRAISLILASSMLTTQNSLVKHWPESTSRWFHQRSVLIANTAATFAQRLGGVCPDTAFVLGLFQEIGIPVMATRLGSRHAHALERARKIGQVQLHSIERDDFRATHAEVSAAVLQRLQLPHTLIKPVLHHHGGAADGGQTRIESQFVRMMQIGEALADLTDLPHPARRTRLNQLLNPYQASRRKRPPQTGLSRAVSLAAGGARGGGYWSSAGAGSAARRRARRVAFASAR